MNSKSIRESGGMERAASCHVSRSVAQEVDIQRLRRENEEHDKMIEQRHQVEEADQLVEEAEKERKEGLQLDAELEKLKLFNNGQELADYIHNLLHIRDNCQKKEKMAYEQVDQLRESLLTLEDNDRLQRLQKNLRLTRLQTELEETRAAANHWETKWNDIQETAAKKTILLGQIKMATLSLYEMRSGGVEGDEAEVEGDEAVDKNDTVKQLDKVMMFMQDHEDILKQY
ncbi:coiled-coil domain-containing protein 42 like-2-like isoform X3 [Cebidichthys violaceus]|uniref:coiled-coil domain-containing protein 42 like-2-like isoform X3 n=1 Tax=Cebidichthys violaceus TaxID=271503 RepID=UPI0035CB26DE